MPLNTVEFSRRSEEVFAASYFSSLGVIQSIALGALMLKVADSSLSVLLVLHAVAMILTILLVVNEYVLWVLIMRQTPRLLDLAFPYLIGIFEYWAIARMGAPGSAWYTFMFTLGLVALLARLYSRAQCTPGYFSECEWLLPMILRNLDWGSGFITAMIFYLGWMAVFGTILSTFWMITTFLAFYGLMAAMALNTSRFLSEVKERFET